MHSLNSFFGFFLAVYFIISHNSRVYIDIEQVGKDTAPHSFCLVPRPTIDCTKIIIISKSIGMRTTVF